MVQVSKATARLDWSVMRLSYGMNGLMFQVTSHHLIPIRFYHSLIHATQKRDLRAFGTYLNSRLKFRPPDHIAVEWFASETPAAKEHFKGRQNAAYRYQLWEHLGLVSSVGNSVRTTPKCYETLGDLMVPVETFQLAQCPHDDLSPCKSDRKVPSRPLIHLGKLCTSKRPKFKKPKPLPAGVVVLGGKRHQSCTQICKASGKKCRQDLFSEINTCETLMDAFPCENGCSYHQGPEQPCYVASNAPPQNLPGSCLVNRKPTTITCLASHELTSRVCPCS